LLNEPDGMEAPNSRDQFGAYRIDLCRCAKKRHGSVYDFRQPPKICATSLDSAKVLNQGMITMGKFAAINAALRDRFWPAYLYLIASIVLTFSALFRAEIQGALCLFGTSFVSLIAAGGLKFGLLRGDKAQRIGVRLVALVLFALACWLSSGLSVQVLGYSLSGIMWGAIGAIIGIISIDQRTTPNRWPGSLQSAEGQFTLGNSYIGGQGPINYTEAAKWYRKAAEQGHAKAQSQLGLMYSIGKGVPQDFAEAARWCRAAAEADIAEAQCRLGDMHIKGQGVSQDYTEAAKWCRSAAQKGDAMAQMRLGALYYNGQGVPRDYVQAQMWLNLAAAGFPSSKAESQSRATSLCEIVAAKMTDTQIAQAQHLAREWKPEKTRPEAASKYN
jgi:TPR repeat protein